MGKNMLCWVLALVLCVSLLPVEAGAVGEDPDVVATVTTGGKTTSYSTGETYATAEAALRAAWSAAQGKTATVTVMQSVTIGSKLEINNSNSDIHLTMADGVVLSVTWKNNTFLSSVISISKGKLTFSSGTIQLISTGVGKPTQYYGIQVSNQGSLVISGTASVTVERKSGSISMMCGIYVNSNAALTMTGGTVTVKEAGTTSVGSYYGIYAYPGNVTISGGTILADSYGGTGVEINDSSSTATISGATITAKQHGIFVSDGTVELKDCNISVGQKSGENYGVLVSGRGTATLSGSTNITTTNAKDTYGVYTESANGTIQIQDQVEITANSPHTVASWPAKGGYVKNGTIEISGTPTIQGIANKSSGMGLVVENGKATISGGRIVGKSTSGNEYGLHVRGTNSEVKLSGGTYCGDESFGSVQNENGQVSDLLEKGYAYYKVETTDGQETETIITDAEKLAGKLLTDLVVRVKPEVLVTSDPKNITVTEGGTATFTVTATGKGDFTYQWQVKTGGEDGEDAWKDIDGATDATYTISATTLEMTNNHYRCVVSNKNCTATSEAATLTVEPVSYKVTVEASEGGTASADYKTATAGATVILTAMPNEGYHFKEWQVTEGNVTIENDSFTMPAGEVTVKAVFEANPAVTLIADPAGGGTVSGGGRYSPGTEVTVTATPAGGYRFVGWQENGATLSTQASHTLTVTENRTLTARFARSGSSTASPTYPVTLEATGQGDLTASHTRARRGTTVTVTATPEAGYVLGALTVTDKNGDPVPYTHLGEGQYTFSMPVGGVKVEVHFLSDGSWQTCPRDETCPIWPYPDASPRAWYHDGVHFCIDQGLMVGFEDGTFRPDGTTSRAMIAVILWRQAGCPVVSTPTPFTDAAEDAWYAPALRWAAAQGVVTGTSPTTFDPEDPITREQLAAMLWRYGGCPESGEDLTAFPDAGEISAYARPALAWAKETGLLLGQDTGLLEPAGYATRAETAQVIWRWVTGVL